jgi:hypothetical protein
MSFPGVAEAMWGLTEPTQFKVSTRTPEDYEAVETMAPPLWFDGTLQPVTTQRLLIKPEGERRWKWFQLWTQKELSLGDSVIAYDGKTYKVMSKDDWSQAGYFSYEITERENIRG